MVRLNVDVVIVVTTPAALAVKNATTTIPVVFPNAINPVETGVVASLAHPGGNVTGGAAQTEPDTRETQAAADALGRQLQVLTASTDRELETAFDAMVQRHIGGLIVGADSVFIDRPEKLPALAARNGVPVIFDWRGFSAAGGLMSYGTDTADAYRHCGNYVGRILKGEKPANLPVLQSTKFEFVINLKTAKALGIKLPPGLLAIADEVIE